MEGEPPLRKKRHNSDNADNLDNDEEVYDHSQKAKARPTSGQCGQDLGLANVGWEQACLPVPRRGLSTFQPSHKSAF